MPRMATAKISMSNPPAQAWKLSSRGTPGIVPVSAVAQDNGIPTRRFKKEVIRKGTYVKVSDGIAFSVTDEIMQNWVLQFRDMMDHGVRVPIPMDRHADEVEETAMRLGQQTKTKNAGWVDDMFTEGDSLYVITRMIGEDAILAAARNDVSLFSPPLFVDGKGRTYNRPITHVALVPNPVIPGLGEFISLAASLAQGSMTVDFLKLLQQLATALGITEPITDQNAEALIVPAFNALIDKAKNSPPPAAPPPTAASTAPTPAAGAAPPLAQPVGEVKEMSVTQKFAASHSPMLVRMFADNRSLKLASLVERGIITPTTKKEMEAQYIGANGEAIALALSANPNYDGGDFDRVVKLLETNAVLGQRNGAARFGEKTGPQVMSLGNPIDQKQDTQTDNLLTRGMDKLAAAAKK